MPELHGFHERGFAYSGMPRWDALWHKLSPQARWAFLKEVKVPQRNRLPHQNQPSVRADRFRVEVLDELRAAPLVTIESGATSKEPDRVIAVIEAADFMIRLRALERQHLLRGDLPSTLQSYVQNWFHISLATHALNVVLRTAGIEDFVNINDLLRSYVVNHRWPGWVAQTLKNPAVDRVVEVLRDANGPMASAALEQQLSKIRRDQIHSATVTLIGYLAAFEDLDPETGDLLVGLLPAVHASRASSLQRKERPPLVVSENLAKRSSRGQHPG